MRCTVFGTGYLGATHAAGMAELGHDVVGVDIDPGKVAKLSAGEVPFYEPGLRKMLSDNLAAGRLRFTTDYDVAADFADVHFLGVGTPQKKGEYGADLRHVHAVIDELVPRLTRPAVIVGKSTVPVGTAAELGRRARALAPYGVDVEVAWNPEFLREGFAVQDTLHPDRIVLGVQRDSTRAEAAVRELYAPLLDDGVPFLLTDLQTAELVKVSANAFLATKISFINAISEVCEAADADVDCAGRCAGLRPAHRPAISQRGTGLRRRVPAQGHPRVHGPRRRTGRQPRADVPARGRQHQHAAPDPDGRTDHHGLRRLVAGCQHRRARRGVQARVRRRARLAGAQRRGACCNSTARRSTCTTHKAMENSRRVFPTLNYSTSVTEACDRADAVLVLTEWQEFVDLDPDDLADVVRARVVVDGRNCLDVRRWQRRRLAGALPGAAAAKGLT